MAGIKISDLTTVTPLSTDLVVLDRPSVGSGAPVTGKATLTAIQSLIGGSGGNEYWQSVNLGELIATGTLVAITGSLLSQFLSSSAGAEITGSSVFYVVEPNQSVVISGSANSGAKALDVIDAAFGPGLEYSAFYVDPANLGVVAGTTDPSNYIALTNDSIYPKVSVVSGSNSIELSPALDTISINVLSTLPTASLQVLDSLNNLSTLDLKIGSLQVNGDAGTSGYVLTSNGDSSAPTWQASVGGGGGNEYWQSTTSDLMFATGTIGAYISGSLRALHLSASAGAEVTGTLDINGGLQVTGSVNVSNGVKVDAGGLQVAGTLSIGGIDGPIFVDDTLANGSSYGVVIRNQSANVYAAANLSWVQNSTYVGTIGGLNNTPPGTTYGLLGGVNITALKEKVINFRAYDSVNSANSYSFGNFSSTGLQVTGSINGSSTIIATTGFSGSLTKLTDGSSYLVAGTNVEILTGTNGAVTISSFGGLIASATIVSSLPYTASITDYIIAVSASAGPGVALPSAAMIGRNYIVKDVSGSAGTDNISVSVDGGGLIDGSSSYTISINRGSATFVYFGNSIGWGII